MGVRELIKGRKRMLEIIEGLPSIPPLTIFAGVRGGGKKLLAQYLAELHNYTFTMVDRDIDLIREAINNSYTVKEPVLYCIPDFEKLSINAMNALLKITEEPPNNSCFITTTEALSMIPATILSRAYIIVNEPYSKEELRLFTDDEQVLSYAKTPADVLDKNNLLMLYDFCKKVDENMTTVSLTNAFKIPSYIALKEEDKDEKIDLDRFLSAMSKIYYDKLIQYESNNEIENARKYLKMLRITNHILFELHTITGIKKDSLLDKWIIQIRNVCWED